MRGRTPVVDDTPKRAPPVPNREAARAADITAVRAAAASCTEGNVLPCFSSPTAVTREIVTSTTNNSIDPQQKNNLLSSFNYQKDHHKESYNNTTTTYYRSNQSTAQDKRSRLTNVINSLYRKVPVNDRSSVERNLETLEKYVMTVLNGVIKDAESSDESGNKNDDVCYSGPNKETTIVDDVKSSSGTSNTSTINRVSSEPSGVEPAVPSVTIAQQLMNDSCDNKHKEEVNEEVKKQESTIVDDVLDNASLATSNDILKSMGLIESNTSNIESSMCEDASDTIETICRELLTDLVNEICQTIDETSSLQCSLPLDKIAPALENCYDDQQPVVVSNSSKSMVRHLCLYCDRKFLSISLRQRHTERVHQLGGGRRSDRNIRKTNCQHCSEKSADNLEGLFQHMISAHADKYHGCLQCSTRYSSKDELQVHINESHPEKTTAIDESREEEVQRSQIRIFKSMKLNLLPRSKKDVKETFQDFDSSFYSNVSYNVRDNLLHHLDGKLHHNNAQCYQQTYHDSTQCPIDISLTAATPVYNKDPSNDESENSSEYAQKPGKIGSPHHPRRVSFEKYNFPKKYDGKEWSTCAIGNLNKFDISTQLILRRKQQMIKDKSSAESMRHEDQVLTDVIVDAEKTQQQHTSDCQPECNEATTSSGTQFSPAFGEFIRLRKSSGCSRETTAKNEEVVYAELTGEWSRPRVYICGACSSKHETLKDVEDHKVNSHPNVWCSHLEFSGDQTELDKHLVLPGKGLATVKAKNAVLMDKVCTKCSKMCNTIAELHKHMLECGGDQAWLLGLFGNNGKKKCKWRPFGSRRRRQRGMKRNIQNSQNSQNQVNKTPKEKQPSGPRVRPSDRETIEKMLANLPAKRSTRRTMQEINLRSQGRMSKIQTRSNQRGVDASNTRLSHKAVLRNKLIKNAKSFQRKRCRGDNISAAIESVISNYGAASKIRRNKANDGTTQLAGSKDAPTLSRRMIKIQDVKSLKNRKTSLKLMDTKGKTTTNSGTPAKRKRAMDLVSSFASLKAKSQLRTTDGKFARNPIKTDQSVELQSTSSSSSQTSGQMTRNTGRKSKDRLSLPGLGKRVTRVSSDADKMPTLEPADKLTAPRATESSKATNELPVLSPVVAKSQSKITTNDDKDQSLVVIKKRGRRSLKNTEKSPAIISDDANTGNKIIHTRTRKSQESQSTKSAESSEDKAQCASTNKKVNAQLPTLPNKKAKSELTGLKRTRLTRRTSLESHKSTADEEKSTANVISKIKRKSLSQKIIKTPLKVTKGKRKLQDETCDNKDITTTRKSPRNIDKKSTVAVEVLPKKTREKNEVTSLDSDNKSDENKIEVEKVNKAIDNPQLDLSAMSDEAKTDSIESKPSEEMVESLREESKNDLEVVNEKIGTKEILPIEIVSDLVNLSFEHLQQESSNSNIDSGKENSSETPINITKSKIPKPKKARGQRRDRKRTLNNVIGILTEGVNIPIEAQQSVVLTVQTSIENINLTSHNSNIQNEPNRLEPADNNATASNTVNNPTDSSLMPEVVNNKDNNDTDSQKIETGEKSSQAASTPEAQSSPSVEPQGSEAKTSVSTSNTSDQFSNDIILDLSRRKQKGKGSFLEKIVSKIAKQKDALLDNDVGSLLDHAVDELSIILDDAAPKSVDNDHQCNSVKKETEKSKVEDKPIETQEQKPETIETMKVEESTLKIGEVAATKVEDKIEQAEEKSESEEKSENSKQIKNSPPEGNESRERQVKTCEVSEATDCRKCEESVEVSSEAMTTSSSLQSINQEETKEIERPSKKRSSDTSPPTKNKKKSTENVDDKKNDEETKMDDELYLTDIMKLINNTNKTPPGNHSAEDLPKGKRKIDDEEPNEILTENSSKEDTSCTNSNKKSRRSQKIAKNENKSINVSNRGRRSSKRNMSVNNPTAADSRDGEIDETKELPNNSIENEKNMEIIETENLLDKKINQVEIDNSMKISQELPALEQEKVVSKPKKRGRPRKLPVDEHLKLLNDQIKVGNKNEISEGEKIIEGEASFGGATTVINNLNTDLSASVNKTTMNETSDGAADKIIDRATNKTTDKSVADNQMNDKQVTQEKSRSTAPLVRETKSRRKNTPGKIETSNIAEIPIQRRQTLGRKAKENIFLSEELLDFGEDIDSPVTKKEVDRTEESKLIDDTQLIKQIPEVRDSEPTANQPAEEEELEKVIEESKPTSEVINELNSNKLEPMAEQAVPVVDEDSPKKRAANFAVVHTKSGEILIVEKKKKFTKEAAKFFCNVCSTSFTRKSSLKKHNLSQSHILQASKCSSDLEVTTIPQVENSIGENIEQEQQQEDEKVLVDDKADGITQQVDATTGNSKINSDETTTFNDQLEDKLLDEEICKITENMSHDEYVLTDHISPEGTPDKQINDEELKSKQKVNLADEHLDLESPSPIPQKSKENSMTMSLSAENIVFSSPQGHSSPFNTKMALDFSNITEKLKANTILHQSEQNIHQTDHRDESCENILQIDEKIEDEEEDEKACEKLKEKLNDKMEVENIDEKLISSDVEDIVEKIVENEENALLQVKNPTAEKTPMKKSKSRGRRPKKKSITENDLSSDSECSDVENVKSQEKNKIVKSVFGRAFTGEKLDKVMEVLDDWNSKSEGDSQDESAKADNKITKNSLKLKHKVSRTSNASEKSFETHNQSSRCRQSKKRAEERISRAFEEESIPYDLVFDSPGKDNEKSTKSKGSSGESVDTTKDLNLHVPPKDLKIKCSVKKPFEIEGLGIKEAQRNEVVVDDGATTPRKKVVSVDEPSLDTNSMESIHTRVPSCPRERSSTPDLVSVTTRDSENEVEDFEDDDDDRLSVRGRLSPFYASNAPESSINSGTMSTSNHVASTEAFVEHRRNSSNEFSGEKIVIRSPVLFNQESGVVTIAPTDAIEDNALDVPQEIDERPLGTRQGKVLNCDEELFVECCSRLKATTENELRGAKKIKLDDYKDETQQSSQGHRQGHADRWRDVESQNSLGSLLDSVNQLLGEEMYNSNRAMGEKHRNDRSRERLSPMRNPQTDFIRPENHTYEDSLDVAFEHNNKLRDKIQQRMRENEKITVFPQLTNNSRNYHYYDQNEKEESETAKMDENNFNNIHYSSKHLPLEPLVNKKIDGFLDEALSNLLHRNGKHDHNGSTPMNVLAELACAQVPTSTTPSLEPKSLEKLPSKVSTNPKESPKKSRNPIRELFERKKELNDRRTRETLNSVKQKSKKSKHKDESSLIRKHQFGVGLAERKKRHNNYDKKTTIESPTTKHVIKDVYEFDDDDSQSDSKFLASKVSYRAKTVEQSVDHKETSEIDVGELMSRTITKSLDDSGKSQSDKRLDSMIERKLQESEYHPKTKGALKSYHMERSGPMDSFVQRKRTRRLTEGSSSKTKRKNKNSKRKSRAWYEDDSSDEFVALDVKPEDVGVGISKSQRTCSKGKQNLFAELSTSSESEYEIPVEDEQKNAEKAVEINDWMADAEAEMKDDLVESDHPLVIDEKESDDANSDEEPSQRAFELDDLYREDSSVASSDSEDEGKSGKLIEIPEKVECKDEEERIPLDEALVLLDTPEPVEKEPVIFKETVREKSEEPVELPEKKVSEKKKEKVPENLPLHVFLSRKVQESKKKKEEEKLKKLKEKERKREEEEAAVEENREPLVEFQSTRRQRKCAIGKQGLLAEISSSDDEYEDKCDYDKSKRQKRESKEKRKERYMEKKHELMIAKEQKAIEQQILREVKMRKSSENEGKQSDDEQIHEKITKKQQKSTAEKKRKNSIDESGDFEKEKKKLAESESKIKTEKKNRESLKKKDESPVRIESKAEVADKIEKVVKKVKKSPTKNVNLKNVKKSNNERRNSKERKSTAGKRDDSDDEEIRIAKSWCKVDEGVGVAIGRRKRAAANQLYYWSSSTDDEEEEPPATPTVVDEDDDRQEQHGWIVGDSHKKMITMLAMEKQLKEKRRRSEDDYESGKVKNNKKYRNSTS